MMSLVFALLIGIVSSQTYDEAKALNALYYSYGSYCDKADIAAWNCKWCLYDDEISQFEVKDVFQGANWIGLGDDQAFIGYDHANARIVIAFRGSSNIDNWIHNLDFAQMKYPHISDDAVASMDVWGPMIHTGFYHIWEDIQNLGMRDSILDMLTTYPNADILVTGHSLGGALASVCALELKQNALYTQHAINRVDLITFGSPRSFNENLAKYFDGVIDSNWRIVHQNDAAPTVPFESMGYHHTSTEIWYTNDDPLEYKQCDGSGEDWGCYYFGYSVPDHLNYMGHFLECPSAGATTTEGAAAEMDSDETTEKSESNSADFKREAVMFSVVAAIGWIFAMVFGCCWFRSRRKFIMQQTKAPYVELNDNL